MLTCYGHRVRLPRSDLAYLAFRLAVQETLSDIDLYLDLEEEPDTPVGYLSEVPFLEQVPLPVQVDLLADAWARHHRPEPFEASLLDAAVVYAACMTACRIVDDMPEVAVVMLRGGPRRVHPRIIKRASFRLEEMFEQFWDDWDFLLMEDFQDLPPDRAKQLKDLLRLPDEVLEPMFEALERWRVSPDVAANLDGLMTEAEIQEALPLLKADVWPPGQHVDGDLEDDDSSVTGIEDRYHGLLVGPCDPGLAESEAECSLVDEIGVGSEDDFDCSYEEWVEHLREEVQTAAQQAPSPPPATAPDEEVDLAERVRQAQTIGLEDGTRIEPRGDGWVVVDSFQSYLADPEDASWIVDPDDEDVPLAVFPTPEAAYWAWQRSETVAKARARRREEALKRLGKS
jgi:hypothetical protein